MCALAEPCTAADNQPPTCTLEEGQIQVDDEINWDNPEYRTAEFRMCCFKVLPCTKPHHQGQPQYWTNCPYAHAGEHACRRDPRKFDYAAVVCPDLLQGGRCPRGESCHSAHSVFEFWLHPQRYRTQICREGPGCRRRVCFFAHSEDELREVQLPPVEGDPFAAAKAAKYSMSSIPSGARKQLSRSSSVPSKPNQGSGSSSSSPKAAAAAAAHSAAQPGAAGSAAAAAAGMRSSCTRTVSDTAALLRSGSAAAAAASMLQQQEALRMASRPAAASSAFAAAAAARRGNLHRLSMDAAAWSNYAAVHQDKRTQRRHSVDAVAAARGWIDGGSAHNSGGYACASSGCSTAPTVHAALPPQLVQLPPRAPAGWELQAAAQGSGGSSAGLLAGVNMAAAAAAAAAACGGSIGSASPGSNWMLQQQQPLMASPQQLQLMQLQLQQQHSGCMTDASIGSRPLDASTASLVSATSIGSARQASFMRQFSLDSAASSSSQLPQLILQQQQQQHAGLDAVVTAGEQLLHLPLQLVSADGLSLDPAGPYVAGSRTGGSSRAAAGVGRPAGADAPAGAGGLGSRLCGVPEGPAAAAAAAAGLQPCGGSGTNPATFCDGSGSSTNSSISCTYAANGVASPSCTSLVSPEGWSPALSAAAASASPATAYQATHLPMRQQQQQQQYTAGSAAALPLHLEGLSAQLQQLQLSGASSASINKLLASYSAQAEITRQQAALAQAAADAANDRLVAYIAALGSSTADPLAAMGAAAETAAASSGVHQAGMAAAGSPSSHAQQVMAQLQPAQQQQVQQCLLMQQQQQQQMLQSDQLMMLLDDQAAAAAAAAPMLGSMGLQQQQQYVLHGAPPVSTDSMMALHVPATTWM